MLTPIDWSHLYASWGLTVSSLEKAYSPSRVLDVLASFLPRGLQHNVLELGCAPGRWLSWLEARLEVRAFGVELDQAGVRLSRSLFPQLAVVRGDAQHLPIVGGRFDAVYSIGLLEHFEDHVPLLTEVRRVLKPGGVCITVMPNLAAGSFHRWHWERFQPGFLSGHKPYTLGELSSAIAHAGLEVVHAERNGLYLPHLQRAMGRLPLRWLLRRLEHPTMAANLAVVARRALDRGATSAPGAPT